MNSKELEIKAFIEKASEISSGMEIKEESTLAEIFDMDASKYKEKAYQSLDLSQRAFNCITRYLNPPIQGIEERWQISDLLNLTIGNYVNVRNLGLEAFEEILSKIKELK